MATRTASQNGRRSRAKGAAWEREVARIFACMYRHSDVRRCIAQSRSAKREGCDVEGTPFWIETKCGAAVDLRAALEQAEADSCGSRPVLVVAKPDRRDPVVYARLETLTTALAVAGRDASWPVAQTPAVTMSLRDFARLMVPAEAAVDR